MEEESRKIYRIDMDEFRKKFPEIEGEIKSIANRYLVGDRRFKHIRVEVTL